MTLWLTVLAATVSAQGTINIGNTSTTLVSTNAGIAGPTSPVPGSFIYGVFTAPSTVTTIDAYLLNLLTSTWTFTGVYATNTALSTGGRFSGGAGVPTVTGWPAGVTNSYLVLGWSANIGTTWSAVSSAMMDAAISSGGSTLIYGGWLGASAIGFGAAGGGTGGLPAFSLISTAGPDAQGTPISTGWQLYTVIPEPGTIVLAGLGAASLMIFRRRK
jgi:hypothetical protein